MSPEKVQRLYLKTLTTTVLYRHFEGTGANRAPTDTPCSGSLVATNSPGGVALIGDNVEDIQMVVVYKNHLPSERPSTKDSIIVNGKQYAIQSFTARMQNNTVVAYDIKVKG